VIFVCSKDPDAIVGMTETEVSSLSEGPPEGNRKRGGNDAENKEWRREGKSECDHEDDAAETML